MPSIVTRSAEDTIGVGSAIAPYLAQGDVLVLTGDLGAGKTQLTKGIAAGLGVRADVSSPTFTIEMVYEGDSLTLYHFDLYRIDEASQLDDTGLFDVLGEEGICVVEWGEQFADQIGPERLDVVLRRLDDEARPGVEPEREIGFVAHGRRAGELLSAIEAVLAT